MDLWSVGMKGAILRGFFGTLVCWPLLELLGWLGVTKALPVALILTAWMAFWWWLYDRLGRVVWWPWRKKSS
jgi:hypothetical protein